MTSRAHQFVRAMPVLQVKDVKASAAFYCDKLGFASHGMWGDPPVFTIVQRGAVTLALDQSRDGSTPPRQQYWSAYLYVADADALLAELKAQGVAIERDIETTEYGCRDFDIRDPDGHILGFGHVLSPDAMGPGLDRGSLGRDRVEASTIAGPLTGGCQCGAIRFRVEALGRPSFCHCRMCQKAFGSTGGALVTAKGLTWTRGSLAHFQSSARIRRGFCSACGTPLTFEYDGYVDVAIPAFDRAAEIRPHIQLSPEAALPWTAHVTSLPGYPPEEHERREAWLASIASNQHPDHDTEQWPPSRGQS